MMKKLIAAALTAVMALTLFAGCGAKTEEPAPTVPDVTVEVMIDNIYAQHAPIDLPLGTMTLDLADPDLLNSYTGLSSADKISEAAASEAMMGQPYSLVVVKTRDAADAAAVAQEMYDGIDQRKWICVEADTKVAAYAGNLVMFFMNSSDFSELATTETMVAAFQAAVGTEVTTIG